MMHTFVKTLPDIDFEYKFMNNFEYRLVNGGSTNTVFLGVVLTLFVWLGQFHWSRRHLYKIASQIDGPPTLPLIGSAHLFLGSPARIFKKMLNLCEKYDPIAKCWFGPKVVYAIAKPEHLQMVLNSPQCLHKDPIYKYLDSVLGSGILTAPVHKWKKNRKVIQPTFSQKILDKFVITFVEKTNIFVDVLKKSVGKGEFDAFESASALTLDTICETAMGVNVHAQTSKFGYGEWLNSAGIIIFLRALFIPFQYDTLFNLTPLSSKLYELINKIHTFSRNVVVTKRKALEEKPKEELYDDGDGEGIIKRKAFLDLLLELTSEGKKFNDEELKDEVITFIAAGTETTATTSSFAFIMLGMHPEVQQKVYEEIIDVLGHDRPITPEDMPKLQYTERFIKETLRLFPPGPFILRQVQGDFQLEEYTLPSDVSVIVPIIHIHRNAKYWTDPLIFNPDRFLPEETAKRHPYSFLPFSAGPRNCIGAKYAMMSLKTIMSAVLRKYELKTPYKTVEELELQSVSVLRPTKGFKISMELRQ